MAKKRTVNTIPKSARLTAPVYPAQTKRTEAQVRAAAWVFANRGVLSRIGKKLGTSPQFVHMVLMGNRKSTNGLVEGELRRAGAPLVGVG